MTDVRIYFPVTAAAASYSLQALLDSTYDSPYRTGRHVPLNNRNTLTSIATASESRADITSSYRDDAARASTSVLDVSSTAYPGPAHSLPTSPTATGRPYSPGMRSLNARESTGADRTADGFETQSPAGEIPMQSFQDGLPPPPPVSHSWSRIDKWADENYPELYDQLCEGCTTNDLNELEHQLDCSLPQDVRDSLQIHDGQERGGTPTGIIFGSMLLDCEEIVQECDNWRRVNLEFLSEAAIAKPPAVPSKAHGGSSSEASSSKQDPPSPTLSGSSTWRQDLLGRQSSVPANAVKKSYAHPAWIPLVRDWGGNNLAVDLAPGPAGQWGQVILFGRDYDTKYVVARSWAAFLALVADDLNSGKWFVDEDTNELKLREFKKARVEPPYFDILRWRMDQKYGRRAPPKRKSVVPGAAASPTGTGSPYASPTEPNAETRGRSMQRLSLNSPMTSPIRPGYGKSSPLARVAEESTAPAAAATTNGSGSLEQLVEVETPRQSDERNKASRLSALANGETVAGDAASTVESTGRDSTEKSNGKQVIEIEETMKTIEI